MPPLHPNIALGINTNLLGGGQQQINPLDLARTAVQIQEGQNQITMQRNQIAAKNGMADLIASTPPDQVAARLAASPFFPWAPDVAETRTRMDLQHQEMLTSGAEQARAEAATGQINLQTSQTALQSGGQLLTSLMLSDPSEWQSRIANIRQTVEGSLAGATPAQRASALSAFDSLSSGLTAGIDPTNPNASAMMRDNILGLSTRFDLKPDQIALMSSHGGTFSEVDGQPMYTPFGTLTKYPMLPQGGPGSWTPMSPSAAGTGGGVMGTTAPPPMGAGPGGLGAPPGGAPTTTAPAVAPTVAPTVAPAVVPPVAPVPNVGPTGEPIPSGPPGSGQEPGGPAQTMRQPFPSLTAAPAAAPAVVPPATAPATAPQPAAAPTAPQPSAPPPVPGAQPKPEVIGTPANNAVRAGIPATATGPGATRMYTDQNGVQYGLSDGKPLAPVSLAGMAPQRLLPPLPTTGKQDYATPQEGEAVAAAAAKYRGQDTDAFNNASLILARTAANRDAYNHMKLAGGMAVPGPGSQWRYDLIRSVQTFQQIFDPTAPLWNPAAEASFTELNKNAVQLGFNGVTQAFGHAGHEAQSIIQASIGAVPGHDNTFFSGQLLNRTFEVLAQRQQDEYNFGQMYARQNNGNYADYQLAYDKLHPIGDTIGGMLKEFGLGPNGFTGATPAETRENIRTAERAGIITQAQGMDLLTGKAAQAPPGQQ